MLPLSTASVQLGQERDEHGSTQWILTYPTDDSCECYSVIGGFNMQTPKRPQEPVVLDSTLRFSIKRFEHCRLSCTGKVV